MNLLLPTTGGSGLYLPFNIASWLMVVIIITLGFIQVARKKAFTFHRSFIWLTLGSALLIVPFLYTAPFQDHMILRVLGVIGGILLFFTCCQFRQLLGKPKQVLWLILVAATIQIIISLGQIFWPYLAFFDWYNPEVQKPFGLFLQPNIMATFLATTIGICLYLCSEQNSNKRITIWLYLILASAAFIIPFLDSLSGWLSLVLVTALLVPKVFRYGKLHALLLLIILLGALLFSQTYFVKPQQQLNISQDNNVQVRKEIYLTTLKMIADKPLQGYGYGSFERAYLDFYNALRVQQPEIPPPLLKLNHPHNEILYWIVEGGLAAALAIICFVMAYFSLFNTTSRFNWPQVLALFGLVSPIVFHAMVEIPFDSAASHWHFLIFLLFFTLTTNNQHLKNKALPSGLLPYTAALLTAGFFIPFLTTTMHSAQVIVRHKTNDKPDISVLNQIINPLPHRGQILSYVNGYKFKQGMQSRNPELIEEYITWAKQQLKFKPRKRIYKSLLLCLEVLNRENEYSVYLREAQRTYPDEKNWQLLKIQED